MLAGRSKEAGHPKLSHTTPSQGLLKMPQGLTASRVEARKLANLNTLIILLRTSPTSLGRDILGLGTPRDTLLLGTPGTLGLAPRKALQEDSEIGHSRETVGLGTPGRLWDWGLSTPGTLLGTPGTLWAGTLGHSRETLGLGEDWIG